MVEQYDLNLALLFIDEHISGVRITVNKTFNEYHFTVKFTQLLGHLSTIICGLLSYESY